MSDSDTVEDSHQRGVGDSPTNANMNPLTAAAARQQWSGEDNGGAARDDAEEEQQYNNDNNNNRHQGSDDEDDGWSPRNNNVDTDDESANPLVRAQPQNKNASGGGGPPPMVAFPDGDDNDNGNQELLPMPVAASATGRNNSAAFNSTGGSVASSNGGGADLQKQSSLKSLRRTGSMNALKLKNNFTAKPLDDILRDRRAEEQELNLSLWDQGTWRSRLYSILEPGSFPSHIPKRYEVTALIVSFIMTILIFISCLSVMGESYPEYVIPGTPVQWALIEIVTVVIFSADIILRFVTCPNRFVFFLDILNLVDLVVVLPFYLEIGGLSADVSWLRMLRVLRLARLVRVLKTSHVMGLNSVISAVQNSVAALFLFIALAGTTLLIIATCMYFAERGEYFDTATRVWYRKCLPYQTCDTAPDGSLSLPSPFQSIPDAFWYTIVTMSTVGFSDEYPTSGIGQFVGAATMLIGVLFIAFPTMVLSGHYDLSSSSARVTVVTWRYIHDQNIARLAKKILPPRTRLMISRGWATTEELKEAEGADDYDPDGDDTDANAVEARIQHSQAKFEASGMLSMSPSGGTLGSASVNLSQVAKTSTAGFGKQASAAFTAKVAIAAARANIKSDAENGTEKALFSGESNVSEAVALFRVGKSVCELRPSSRYRHQYLYPPLYKLRRGINGDPKGTVLFGTNGMPTLVQFDLILDTPEARSAAKIIAQKVDPKGSAEVDLGGGLQVRHHTPLSSLEACGAVETALEHKYEMRDLRARNGIRSTTTHIGSDVLSVPIYFARIPNKSSDRHMIDEEDYLRKEDVLAECMASVMGSSLVISDILPGRVARKRVMVVSQMIQQSRLHREVELTSFRAIGIDPTFDERLAYFSQSDVLRLMEGVHRKVDLFDTGLYMIEPAVVDLDVTQVLLGRLRHVEIRNVLPKYQDCIFNTDVLTSDDVVYEIPLSLFAADEEDVVEEDSLGYIEVSTRPAVGSHLRVDFSTDFSGIEALTNAELRGFHVRHNGSYASDSYASDYSPSAIKSIVMPLPGADGTFHHAIHNTDNQHTTNTAGGATDDDGEGGGSGSF